MGGSTIKEAIKMFEEKKGVVAAEAEKVELNGTVPPIEKIDAGLSSLKACKHLALSTNSIEKMGGLSGMDSLKILSLGRNIIKKVEGLDAVAETLEELWLSYNNLTSLTGVDKALNLRVLYMSNNKVASWAEVEKLASLAHLEDLLLVGNPLYNEYKDGNNIAEYRVEALRRLPNLKKLDGIPIDVDEREQAAAK